jgi:pyrroline-5-carboxylate reductase
MSVNERGDTQRRGEEPGSDATGIAILGGGNIGRALAVGWAAAGLRAPDRITLTRRHPEHLDDLVTQGFRVGNDNVAALEDADVVLLAVQPQQLEGLAGEIRGHLEPGRHQVISVVSSARLSQLRGLLGDDVPVVRAMPNTGIAIGESMTCLAGDDGPALEHARALFDAVGRTLVIDEALMTSATALSACGIAFFLRAIRAASQGGIEIGFHPDEAFLLAAQTARGAAGLLLGPGAHPEAEIDRVTTPRGCTITGLNELEHRGFSSAFIKAILASAEKAVGLYPDDD